jgi:hypothetical protein
MTLRSSPIASSPCGWLTGERRVAPIGGARTLPVKVGASGVTTTRVQRVSAPRH